ncbi:putative secreted protein (Por secretion system target) [Breznakibacter xylanolyticus]|uniref:Putative secreted protein (Por secretion system target) n=1 Tax=Breznakibacter xylanolyticus TaxID=990 RepID=A0A2W7NVW5_9BACT|nr:FG-GAP-like repeat-containing protein [Breznakibacter xylanolyticus]PZX15372.1 putative secreted protein (Por secretion system target) [Breznakibacter xylanolyticus]
MRKKLLFVRQWRQWNRLVAKFNKVHQRLAVAMDANEHNQLLNKLKTVFHQLEKMQSHTGIRLAGTALALVLTAATANAQEFKLKGDVKLFQTADLEATGTISMAFADLDQDGDQDLYLGMRNGTINEFLNDGIGNFTSHGTLKNDLNSEIKIDYGCILTFGDIDSDGDLDLIASNDAWYSSEIQIFKNTNGVFKKDNSLSHPFTWINSLKMADVDGDGDVDLLIGFQNYSYEPQIPSTNSVMIFKNEGGNFSNSTPLKINGTAFDSYDFDMADINGDSKVDFIDRSKSELRYYPNDGTGTFTNFNYLLVKDAQYVPKTPMGAIADVDGDGILDVCNLNGDKINLYKDTEIPGTFSSSENLKTTESMLNKAPFTEFTLVDLNNDGVLELFFSSNSNIGTAKANSDGDFIFQEYLSENNTLITSNRGFSLTQLDPSGQFELIIPEYDSYDIINFIDKFKLQKYAYSQDDQLIKGEIIMTGTDKLLIDRFSNFEFADLTGDGYPDLFVPSNNDGMIYQYAQTENGFQAPVALKAGEEFVSFGNGTVNFISFGDIDNDGNLDLFVSGYSNESEAIKVYLQNSDNEFVYQDYMSADGDVIKSNYNTFTSITNKTCGLDVFVYDTDKLNPTFRLRQYLWTDITAPELTLPADATVKIEIGTLTYTVNGTEFDPLVATDNCDGLVVTNNFNNSSTLAGESIDVGTHTVTWTATDKTGNKTELSMSIEVKEKASSSSFAAGSPLSVLPNPTAGSVTVETGTDQPGTYGVESLSGTRLLNGTIENGRAHIDLSAMPNGIYLVRVTVNGDTQTVKIVKN